MHYTNIVLWVDSEMEYAFKLVIIEKNFLICMVKEENNITTDVQM